MSAQCVPCTIQNNSLILIRELHICMLTSSDLDVNSECIRTLTMKYRLGGMLKQLPLPKEKIIVRSFLILHDAQWSIYCIYPLLFLRIVQCSLHIVPMGSSIKAASAVNPWYVPPTQTVRVVSLECSSAKNCYMVILFLSPSATWYAFFSSTGG